MIKKGLAIAVILLFVGMCVVPSTAVQELKEKLSPISFDGNTLYVGGSGSNNYTVIQEAINDAVDGDTVFVYDDSAPYYENVIVDRSIDLIGEDRNTTIIDGEIGDIIIKIISDNVVVSGFTLTNGYMGIAIISDFCIISGNIIEYFFSYGIILEESNKCVIENNLINSLIPSYTFFTGGISLDYCSSIEISHNGITNTAYGLDVWNSEDCNITHNYLGKNIWGVEILDGNNTIVQLNTFENNLIAFNFDSARNVTIVNNNFINNLFNGYFFIIPCDFDGNYWNRDRLFPKIISGGMDYLKIFDRYLGVMFPWFCVDWNPASEPYDIGG